jgi:transposase
MRGSDERWGSLCSYVDIESRVPAKHPLRTIKRIVDDVLVSLDRLYEGTGRQSIAPERLLRASLLQTFYSVRSERQLMEQIDYNLLFRWFVGSASTMLCGTTRRSRRTGIGCSMPTSPRNSSQPCCVTHG